MAAHPSGGPARVREGSLTPPTVDVPAPPPAIGRGEAGRLEADRCFARAHALRILTRAAVLDHPASEPSPRLSGAALVEIARRLGIGELALQDAIALLDSETDHAWKAMLNPRARFRLDYVLGAAVPACARLGVMRDLRSRFGSQAHVSFGYDHILLVDTWTYGCTSVRIEFGQSETGLKLVAGRSHSLGFVIGISPLAGAFLLELAARIFDMSASPSRTALVLGGAVAMLIVACVSSMRFLEGWRHRLIQSGRWASEAVVRAAGGGEYSLAPPLVDGPRSW